MPVLNTLDELTLTTPAEPILTVNAPAPNAVVGLNKPFQVSGQVTDRGMPEPINIDSVAVQVDGGPLVDATLKQIPDKKLTKFTFQATTQVTGGTDPHTVTVVATNDQHLHAKKTITVFAGPAFQVDAPAVLLDIRTLIPITANDPQVLGLIGTIQKQLGSLSDTLASAGKVLIGPNLVANPVSGTPETQVRVGLWIEDPGFPVIPPSVAFPLPRLSDAAAADSFALVPFLSAPNPIQFPSFALSIPTKSLQIIVDTITPAIKTEASKNDLTVESVKIRTSSPATVKTNVSGHLPADVPASFTITETVGLKPAGFGLSSQMVPAVLSTDSSSSVGGLLDWLVGELVPLIGGLLVFAFYKVSVGAGQQSGVAGGFLDLIPSNIPFGNQAISLPAGSGFQMPDFPMLAFFWNSFGADSSGLLGSGVTEIDPRDQSMVQVILRGPDSFTGFQNDIIEKADPIMGYFLVKITPDSGKFGWQITGAGSRSDSLDPPSPVVQGSDFFPSFPLPLKVPVGDIAFKLTVNAVETCQSDATKTLSGSASKAVKFHVKKNLTGSA